MHPQERHHCALPRLADSVVGVLYLGVQYLGVLHLGVRYMVCGIALVHED